MTTGILRQLGPLLDRTLRAAMVLGLGAGLQAVATTVEPPEFNTLVNESDYVIHAVTRSVTAEKRPSARGVKIVTRVELDVVERVAGTAPDTVVLELVGGRVGREALVVEGMPQFYVGDENILFVRDNGRSVCPLVGMMHGRYRVERDAATGRRYVVRNDGRPLRTTAEVTLPNREQSLSQSEQQTTASQALGPTEFIQQIKAAVAAGSRLNREK